jgi:hypothetical protein
LDRVAKFGDGRCRGVAKQLSETQSSYERIGKSTVA